MEADVNSNRRAPLRPKFEESRDIFGDEEASQKVDGNANRDPKQGTKFDMMEVLSRVAENAAEAVDAALRESDEQTGDASSSPSS